MADWAAACASDDRPRREPLTHAAAISGRPGRTSCSTGSGPGSGPWARRRRRVSPLAVVAGPCSGSCGPGRAGAAWPP
jgi:hypothetical protein